MSGRSTIGLLMAMTMTLAAGSGRAEDVGDLHVVSAELEVLAREASTMPAREGYARLMNEGLRILERHRQEVPGPFYVAMKTVRAQAWRRAQFLQARPRWEEGRRTWLEGIRFARETGDFFTSPASAYRAMARLVRDMNEGQEWSRVAYSYEVLGRHFEEVPEMMLDPSPVAAVLAIRRAAYLLRESPEVQRSLAEVMAALAQRVVDARGYYALASEAADRVEEDAAAWGLMQAFLMERRDLLHGWGEAGAQGLLEAATTRPEAAANHRREGRRLLTYLQDGPRGFADFCALLDERQGSPGVPVFSDWSTLRMLAAVPEERIPAAHRETHRRVVTRGDSAEVRAFVARVARGGES